jgi:predicted Zn-dependent protease
MALALGAGGCVSTPGQDRDELRAFAEAYQADVQARGLLVTDDPGLQSYLESFAAAIAAQAPGGPIQFQIGVRRDPAAEATVLQDGVVYLNAGLLATVADESQLALVIGHLLNRLALDHLRKASYDEEGKWTAVRLSHSFLGPFAALPVARITRSIESDMRALDDEADAGGMQWLARAGFASEAAPALFTELADRATLGQRNGVTVEPERWVQRREHCSSLVANGAVPANPGGRNDVAVLRRAVSRVTVEAIRLEVADGEYLRASHDAELARQHYGESARLNYLQGKSELLQGFWLDRAEGHMRGALERNPSNRLAQRGLGEVLLAKGDSAGAAEIFTAYLRANPQASDASIALALLHKSTEPAVRDPTPRSRVKVIAIAPVEPAIPRLQLFYDEKTADRLEADAAEVQAEERDFLRIRGFEPRVLGLDEATFALRPELRFQLTQVQRSRATALQKLGTADRNGAEAVFRGTLDEIHELATFVGADALLLTRLEAGRSVALCLVDVNTGAVLYRASSASSRGDYSGITADALEKLKR